MSLTDVIWTLEELQEEIVKKQARKNGSAERDCKLQDSWIALNEQINFLKDLRDSLDKAEGK